MLSTIDSMSTFLKVIFPKHLIADGGEGFDDHPDNYATMSNNYSFSGVRRRQLHQHGHAACPRHGQLPLLSGGLGPDYAVDRASDGQTWIDGHEALAKAAGKVAYWGEFGFKWRHGRCPRAHLRQLAGTFFGATDNGALAMFWQLVPQSRGADEATPASWARSRHGGRLREVLRFPRASLMLPSSSPFRRATNGTCGPTPGNGQGLQRLPIQL